MLYYLCAQCVYLQVYTNLWKNIVAVGTDQAFYQINVSIKLLRCSIKMLSLKENDFYIFEMVM